MEAALAAHAAVEQGPSDREVGARSAPPGGLVPATGREAARRCPLSVAVQLLAKATCAGPCAEVAGTAEVEQSGTELCAAEAWPTSLGGGGLAGTAVAVAAGLRLGESSSKVSISGRALPECATLGRSRPSLSHGVQHQHSGRARAHPLDMRACRVVSKYVVSGGGSQARRGAARRGARVRTQPRRRLRSAASCSRA